MTSTHRHCKLLFLGLALWAVCLCIIPSYATAGNQTEAESVGGGIMTPVIRADGENTAPAPPAANASIETPLPADDYFKSQPESNSEFSWSNYFLVVGCMFLLLALLWFAVWALKKRNAFPGRPGFSKNTFKVESSLPLGSRRALMVVRFANSRYLLGVTDQQINLIKELNQENAIPEENPASPSPVKAFAAILENASQKSDN